MSFLSIKSISNSFIAGLALTILVALVTYMYGVFDLEKIQYLCNNIPLRKYIIAFSIGIGYTLLVSVCSIVFGTILAVLAATLLTNKKKSYYILIPKAITYILIYIFLSIPALVLIVFIFYGSIMGINFNSILSAIIALSLNLSPFATRIIESAINNINEDFLETANAFGYEGNAILWKFKIPIILKYSIEPLLVQWITTIKLSSLASVIGVAEILFQGNAIIAETYQTEVTYIGVIICYIIIVVLFNLLVKIISNWFIKLLIK